jgi:hypothetical protein
MGEYSGDVFKEAATGNVGYAVDVKIPQQVENRFDIDSCGGKELFCNGAA